MQQPKVNPIFVNEPRHFNGKSVTGVTIVLGAMNDPADFGPNDAIQTAIQKATLVATPILMSAVDLATGTFDMYFEGDFYSMGEFGPAKDLTFAEYIALETGATVTFQDPAKYGLVAEVN